MIKKLSYLGIALFLGTISSCFAGDMEVELTSKKRSCGEAFVHRRFLKEQRPWKIRKREEMVVDEQELPEDHLLNEQGSVTIQTPIPFSDNNSIEQDSELSMEISTMFDLPSSQGSQDEDEAMPSMIVSSSVPHTPTNSPTMRCLTPMVPMIYTPFAHVKRMMVLPQDPWAREHLGCIYPPMW